MELELATYVPKCQGQLASDMFSVVLADITLQ